jgi:hypothetical protein
MFRFDNPDLREWFGASTALKAADVLMLPLALDWGPWASSHLRNALQWLLFVANSALWGERWPQPRVGSVREDQKLVERSVDNGPYRAG